MPNPATAAAVHIGWGGYLTLILLGLAAAALVQAFTRTTGLRLIWAQIRMTAQLILMGFVLVWIFSHPHPLVTLGAALVMIGFAVLTVIREHHGKIPRPALWRIGIALTAGSAATCAIFVIAVVQVNPLVNPRYLLPLLGMILGNAMTAMNIGVRAMLSATANSRRAIETALYLGATKNMALQSIARDALIASLTPTLTTMLSLGIVMIPGMMTGQLLSGAPPLGAVAYQLGIMVAILFAVVTSTLIALTTSRRYFLADIPD